jgi:hypothetical protein
MKSATKLVHPQSNSPGVNKKSRAANEKNLKILTIAFGVSIEVEII